MTNKSNPNNFTSKYFKKNGINYILCLILLFSTFLRFYSYDTRWGLAYGQAWFTVIARHALSTFQLPFLGPFASGGPFQTGGEWFWIVMAGTLLNPFSVISPWVGLLLILQLFTILSIIGTRISEG